MWLPKQACPSRATGFCWALAIFTVAPLHGASPHLPGAAPLSHLHQHLPQSTTVSSKNMCPPLPLRHHQRWNFPSANTVIYDVSGKLSGLPSLSFPEDKAAAAAQRAPRHRVFFTVAVVLLLFLWFCRLQSIWSRAPHPPVKRMKCLEQIHKGEQERAELACITSSLSS